MDYEKLVRFYLACVTEEDRRSKQVEVRAVNKEYIIPEGDAGALFRDAEEVSWTVSEKQERFLKRYAGAVERTNYLYGYPVYRGAGGYLLPLFMTEVEAQLDEDRQVSVRAIHPSVVQVNLHLFKWTHPQFLEQMGLQVLLEAVDYGTFDARLQKAFEELGERSTLIEELVTQPGTEGWKNRSLVFRDKGGTYTHQLRRELGDMQKKNLEMESVGTGLEKVLESATLTKSPRHTAQLLEIVPLNRSQRAAAKAALSEDLTVITGPPGTGKSQVVINLIASMEAAGHRVLFASKNNRAVDVVREKIAEVLECDDWTLRLGSKKRIDEERQARTDQAMSIEESNLEVVVERGDELDECIEERDCLEWEYAAATEAVLKYSDSLSALRKYVGELPLPWQKWWDSGGALDWPELSEEKAVLRRLRDVRALSGKQWVGLRLWVLRFFLGPKTKEKYEDKFRDLVSSAPDTIPGWSYERSTGWQGLLEDYEVLSRLYSCARAAEHVESALSNLKRTRVASKFREEYEGHCETIQECARDTCRARVRNRIMNARGRLPTLLRGYFGLTERVANPRPGIAGQIQRDFSRAAKALLSVTPGVIVTSLSARRSLPSERGMFDCVIIDEASQCDIASALPLLLRAKRVVVIGDPQQLRHISSIRNLKEQELAEREGAGDLLARYSYCRKSLYDCAAETYEESGREPFFLAEHYRSHPKIIEFSNRTYYRPHHAGLIIRTRFEDEMDAGVFWHDVRSSVDRPRGSLLNAEEACKVVEIAKRIVTHGSLQDEWTMGIVTPYNRQRNYIENLLQQAGLFEILENRLKVGSVHTFQGSEADIMIFSPVVAEGADAKAAEWLSKEEGLLNVALTRARRVLHIVGDKTYCAETSGPLGELAEFVNQAGWEQHGMDDRNPGRPPVRTMLKDLRHFFQEEWFEERYSLDFVVVGLSGTRYDIEIDGRQHYFDAEAIREDEARDRFLEERGYKVIRIRTVTIQRYPDSVREVLSRLA